MRSALVLCVVCTVLILAGCNGFESYVPGFVPGDTLVLPSNTNNLTAYTGQEAEPNNDFSAPQSINLPPESMIDITASLSDVKDMDIYDIGAASANEQITVTANCSSSLNLAAAVFDEQQRLLSCNDDRSWQMDTRPSLSVVLRHDCQHCYVVIAASPTVTQAQGPYTLRILRETTTIPAARPQVLYLSFAGGKSVMLPDTTMANIPAFSASGIDPSFANDTAAMEAAILSHIQNHYARFNVQVVSSTQLPTPPNNATVLYFGLYNAQLLGLADNVDEYNTDLTQMAIIFTDTFRLFMPLQPTAEEMAVALANVASHEAGHLLGLEHTQDWDDLMDTTAPADALLKDQEFKTAPLYNQVFPVGLQDGVMLLTETLGSNPNAAAYNIDRSSFFVNTVDSADNRPSVNTGAVPSNSRIAGSTEASAVIRQLLLHGQRSGQGYVSKDLFAVHSRGSIPR